MRLFILSSLFVLFLSFEGSESFGFIKYSDYSNEDDCECDPANSTEAPATTEVPTSAPTTTPITTAPPPPRTALECPQTIANVSDPSPPPADSCDAGWTAFRRIKGIRCLKTFTGGMNQPESQAACVAQNATLSGIENSNERDWIHEQFRPLVMNVSDVRTVWLGGFLKAECWNLRTVPSSCLPKTLNSFYWTDPSVTGTDGFCPWWLTDPDNASGRVITPCLQFTILKDATPVTRWLATQGSLDDIQCNNIGPMIIGYVCSKDPIN